jgi:hypothetical protein
LQVLRKTTALKLKNKHKLKSNPTTLRQQIELNFNNQPSLLTGEQLANPFPVITVFCRRFCITYARRELWDWLQAGITFSGTWPENLWPDIVFNLYDYLSCLIEAAYELEKQSPGLNGKAIRLSNPDLTLV